MHSQDEIRDTVLRFVAASRTPALIEPGEEPLPIQSDTFAVETHNGRLILEAWSEQRNLARRIQRIHDEKPGRLELVFERFGRKEGLLALVDLAMPKHAPATRQSVRRAFRDRFRRALSRQFPGWRIAELSTEPDLEHSLSPAFPRAYLRKGGAGWAAIAAPPETADPARALTFGLIWLDYLRRRETRTTVEGLALLLPSGRHAATALRLRYLNPNAARFALFVYCEEGFDDRLDPQDYGNLRTVLAPASRPDPASASEADLWVDQLLNLPGVEAVARNDGSISLRVRGFEFARRSGTELLWGLETKRPARASNLKEIVQLATELARLRSPEAQDRRNPLFQRYPEAWLESQVRANLPDLDAALCPHPVYGQVPAFAGTDRGVLDLLAAGEDGRLAVLELKASADLHLPLQALDYWMRVRWHAEHGEFGERGYFPGLALSRQTPRLMLVSPALEFHPTTGSILRYFSPEVPVERVGLGVEWQSRIRVMFRVTGAQSPMWH